MGGGICSLFASTFPECVDRLIMLDFVAFGEGVSYFVITLIICLKTGYSILIHILSNVMSETTEKFSTTVRPLPLRKHVRATRRSVKMHIKYTELLQEEGKIPR